jgi:hypothetical protein
MAPPDPDRNSRIRGHYLESFRLDTSRRASQPQPRRVATTGSTESVRVVVDAVPATAIDTDTDQVNREDVVTAFYYRVDGQVYGAESIAGSLLYATPRLPHADW